MIPLLLAAATAAVSAPITLPRSYTDCAKLAAADPTGTVNVATAWRVQGGGIAARQCLGLAYANGGRWAPAALAFEQAARQAATEKDIRVTDLWSQTGNARLAADQPAEARAAFDAALATAPERKDVRGEIYMDRARAFEAAGDAKAALADLDMALGLVPGDPMGWLLKATLERRASQFDAASHDIAEAEQRAPGNADVALEAGNIAAGMGDMRAARGHWQRAAASGDARVAKPATEALADNPPEEAGKARQVISAP